MLLLAAAASQLAAPSRVCLAPPADGACLSWTAGPENITFTGTWPAQPPPYVVGWGAWGISSVSCGSMYPAAVWMAIKGPAGVPWRTGSRIPTPCRAVKRCSFRT